MTFLEIYEELMEGKKVTFDYCNWDYVWWDGSNFRSPDNEVICLLATAVINDTTWRLYELLAIKLKNCQDCKHCKGQTTQNVLDFDYNYQGTLTATICDYHGHYLYVKEIKTDCGYWEERLTNAKTIT